MTAERDATTPPTRHGVVDGGCPRHGVYVGYECRKCVAENAERAAQERDATTRPAWLFRHTARWAS